MRPYEMMLILRVDLPEDDFNKQLETIQGWIENNGGRITGIDDWGRRRMAYEIADQRDGHYLVYDLEMPTSAPEELKRNLRLTENVLRYLITRGDE